MWKPALKHIPLTHKTQVTLQKTGWKCCICRGFQGVLCEIVFVIRSYSNTVSPTWWPKHELNKGSINWHATMDWKKPWGFNSIQRLMYNGGKLGLGDMVLPRKENTNYIVQYQGFCPENIHKCNILGTLCLLMNINVLFACTPAGQKRALISL